MSEDGMLRVALGERSYDIAVGEGLIGRAGALMRPVLRQDRVYVVADDNLAATHLPALEAGLRAGGVEPVTFTVPAGEASKDVATFAELVDRLLGAGVDRNATVVAFGGGVVGDLAGFAAAATLRGLDYIQVPTSLLAQVDSSVGGKTGINSRHGKNLIGAFHQPRLVLADIAVLDSLPPRELRAGYAEVVKYGLLGDADFFAWLEDNGAALLAGDRAARRHAVLESCAAKARIVAEDETESSGRRALLNLGHTFGHALEAEAGYDGTLLHGEAVAIGMVMAFDFSVQLGLCPADDAARTRRHIAEAGLPVSAAAVSGLAADPDTLIGHMRHDKKARDGRLAFVLARALGDAYLDTGVDEAALRDFLAAAA